MKLCRLLLGILVLAAAAGPAAANITSTSLRIEGAGLRVINDPPVTTGIDMPATIQTSFGNRQNDEAPALEGLLAVGELTGPGLDTPIPLTTAPGHKFQIPGLQKEGVYYLQNIRLMKGDEFLQYATPAATQIIVADLLKTKVTVRQLTADEIRARGIIIDARNFDVYEFSFTFIIDGKEVVIPFPVIVDPRTHQVQPVPREFPFNIPGPGLIEPPRWTPPAVIPLDFGEEGELPEPGKDPVEWRPRGARPSMPAAIVIPNGLAVMHQFFAVSMMVTNGAPEGSAARLENIRATMRIENPGALRTVKTLPAVSFGQPVPIVDPESGTTFLVAQGRGEAEWTMEGLQPGTHRIDFDLRATLKQPGQNDILLRATPSAAIVIHNPRFNITFSHPDVVRKGIEYSTYAFLTNLGESEREVIVTSGVPECGNAAPDANVCRLNGGVTDLIRIAPGEMKLIEYKLRPGVTGQVFATAGTLSDTDVLSAAVSLHMGVSESGIPLSPATLILPYYAQFVSQDVVSANLELFGLGYSLATAPLTPVTARFPRVIKTDVFTRAVDVARAGQRIFITDNAATAKRDSIMHLALDLLGNGGYALRQWDELRRSEKSGRKAGAAVMRELEATALTSGATMSSFIEDFAEVTAHRGDYVAALAHGNGPGERPYAISFAGATSARLAAVNNEAESDWKRDLPFADISRFNGAGESGELGIVGRYTEDVAVKVTPSVHGMFALDVVYPHTEAGRMLRAHFNINGTQGQTITIAVTRGATTLNAYFPGEGGIAAVGTVSVVEPAPLRLEGARQDMHLDKEGHKVSVLFNRPVKAGEGVDLRTRFTGEIDFNRDSVVYKAPRPISAAALQEDGRTVNVTFDHTLSVNATYTIEVGSLVDPLTTQPVSFPGKVSPKIDNDLPAGVIYGKVLKGDNTPIAGADVVIRQFLPYDGSPDPKGPPQYDISQQDGAFLFEFVRRQTDLGWNGAYRLEGFSSVHGKTSVDGSVRLPGKVHFVSLQFLGRGAAQGTVRYNDGSVVAGADVVVGSTMFDQFRSAKTDANGFYSIEDLPVGPLTFSAKDEKGNVTYAAAEIATPGQIVTQNLSIYRAPFPGTGRVYGIVRRSDTNAALAGVRVGVYSQGYGLAETRTDADGRYEFNKVPAGFVTVLAADFSVAPEAIAIDHDLKADEVKEVNVLLFVPQQVHNTKLTGEVFREKATAPGTYERVPGALVKIDGYKIVTADAEGKFTYENLPTLFSDKTITAYDPATQRIKSVTMPTLTEAGPNHVSITIAAFDRGYGMIRVRLLNAAGKPVPNYRVILPGFPPDELIEVGSGIYELRNVPVGPSYEIWAVSNGIRPEDGSPDPRPYGSQVTHGSAKVAFNGHISALTLRLPGQGTVRVKVRSQFDLISDVSLTHSIWWEGEQRMVALPLYASTNKNGEADWAVFDKVPALAGYSVASAHPQYGAAGSGGTLAFDGDFDDHILQLNTLAKVSGTVYAIDGVTPIAGATVRINNGRSDPGPQLTGPDGRFEFFDQPSATNVYVTAEVTQSGIYRLGVGQARTPNNGGFVDNMAVILRKRGFVDGKVVYKDYKVFDPNNAANNVPDNTPGDYSDNAPVPLAKFHLRELDYPNRTFGTSSSPLSADVGGRFQINNVFVGSLRATAWDSGNEELRGDWVGSIDEEGEEATPKAYIAVGGGGVGELEVQVVDPNQAYLEIVNADVSLSGGGGVWDFTTTGSAGKALFQELPIGTYNVSAYSKALGKTSRTKSVTVTRDATASARLELEFSGTVDGTLTDPEEGNAPVPGSHVRLTASNYQQQATTDVGGAFLFLGVREGTFRLDAKDTDTNRRATAERTLTVLDPHRTVNLQLEPIETLHFAAYLPNDTGGNSGILAPPQRVEAKQRCWRDISGAEHCEYRRQLQGNPIQFPGLFENDGYGIVMFEAAENRDNIGLGGSFPLGTAGNPFKFVFPAFGDVRVTVTQGGAPASGAKVSVYSANKTVTAYTDASGIVIARGLRLGGVSVQAQSSDDRFTGSASVNLERTSVMPSVSIALGTYAGVTGKVLAEAGGPSVGTRVVAHFPGGSGTGEIRTNENGEYTFLGIPTSGSGATRVNLTFIGPDDTTVGAYAFKDLFAGNGVETVNTVTLDATPPQFEGIVPADNSTNVSPDTSITVTFSEAIASGSINTNNFQLVASDGSGNVNCALTTKIVDGKFAVVMTPPKPPTGFPLRSNTLYRVIISSGITDNTGHRLPAPLGFTFTTTDYTEPRVLKVLPANPIPKTTTFEFRFNEQIDPAPWQPGGNGTFHVYKLFAPGGAGAAIDRELVSNAFLDPNRMALFIALDDAPTNRIEPESFYRVVFNGVRDDQQNPLAEQTNHFYSFDEVQPHIVFTSPAASTQLVSGSEYEIKVDFKNGSTSGTNATDVKEVRWFTIGADNQPKQFAYIQQSPFTVKIVGPEAPPAGLQYTIGAQARDTSGNEGPMATITWTVKPNVAPANVVVAPVQTASYPSLPVSARVTFDDEGSFASILTTFSVPKTDGTTASQNFTKEMNRLSNGQWPEALFTYTIPATATPGAVVTVTAVVTDVRGLVSAPATATIDVTADTIQPQILTVSPPPGTTFFNTNKYVIEAIVKDAETGVKTVTFSVDGEPVALGSVSAGPTPGTQKFRSVQVEARSKAEDANIPIVVTAKDYNDNARSTTFDVLYKGVNDPDAPKVTWLCPIDRGALPAETSFALKLRLRVIDEDIRSVKFLIGGTTVTGAVTGTDEYGVTHTFTTPAPGTLTITAVVEDTVETHKIELPITLDVVAADFKLQDALAITNDNKGTYQGKTIALIGGGAVLAPQVPLTLANLLVLNGARVETLPATITREFRVDVTTTGITYVDCDSSVNVSEKGYVGGWQNTSDGQNNESRGRTVGNQPMLGAVYGSVFEPTDLGSGGAGAPTCCMTGSSGGGAIALRGTPSETNPSRIVIAGSIRADGGGARPNYAPGDGGSIWIHGPSVLFGPRGYVSSLGGDDEYCCAGYGGGRGGRIAITASTKLDVATATIDVHGGYHYGVSDGDRNAGDGGSGTIYMRKPGQERGELLASSYDSRFPNSLHHVYSTPLGRIRKGTSTALTANALTDTSRTFDKWMIGEELVLAGDPSRTFTVVGISADNKSLNTDPLDGSMLAAAGTQSVAYEGMVVFDKVTVGKRALVAFDQYVSANGVIDDKTAMTIDPTAAVVLRNEQVSSTVTTTPASGSNVVLDTPVNVTYSITAAAGVRSIELLWSLDSTQRIDIFNDYPVTTTAKTVAVPVPSTAPLGPATLNIRVVDRAGRTYNLPARTYTVTPNTAPVIDSFTVAPTSVYAGHSVTATVTATDDISVKNVSFDAKLNGTSIKTAAHTPNTPQATQTFTVPLANDVAGGTPLTIDVSVSDGFAGRAPTTAVLPVTILTDTVAPQVAIISPEANTSYRESVDKIVVRVTAIDAEVAVKEAFAQLDGATPVTMTQVGTTNEWRVDITAPPVDGETDVQGQVTITVKDYAGNAYVSTPINVTIKPVIDSNAPVLKWLCAAPGAMYPTGYNVKLRVSAVAANAQNPVQSVQMFVNDSQTSLTVASLGSNLYEATYPIAADAVDGTVVRVRAIGRSAGGAASDLLTNFTIVVPNVPAIAASTTIEPTNTTYDNKTVVITGGTVTIRGPHTFDRLLLLGGTITSSGRETLDITSTRGTYISCDGAVDLTGHGYGRNETYPGATGVGNATSGSHIGRGGLWDGPHGTSYGSIYRPNELGAGGGQNCCSAGSGGGIVRMKAGSLALDGAIRSDGNRIENRGGAGGSVWITTGLITGSGRIQTNGGDGHWTSGGGGAIAVEYTDPTSTLPTLQSMGGNSTGEGRHGGPGSIYTFGPTSTYGDLRLDHFGRDGQWTQLPSLGDGVVQAGTTGTTVVTNRSTDIPPYFAGHWVEIRNAAGTLKGTWRIATVSGKNFTLEGSGITVAEGDKWQGVYRFDNLTIKGVLLDSVDPIRAPQLKIETWVVADRFTVDNLHIASGASLTSVTGGTLTLDVANELKVDAGGIIDLDGRGYGRNTTYPGATGVGNATSGSHIGRGGLWDGPHGTSYGSLYRPMEHGAGGGQNCCSAGFGGGVLRVRAGSVVVNGTIRANGTRIENRGGAGGSIWITTGRIVGTGIIQTNGGDGHWTSGGGGAISIEYTDPLSILPTRQSMAGNSTGEGRHGGPGSIYTFGPTSTYGDVRVDHLGRDGQWVQFPALGSGIVQSGTSGAVVVTDRSTDIPPYFAGHWVEIRDAAGTLKGTWRIATVSGKSFTFEGSGITVAAGDRWQGVYRFDNVTFKGVNIDSVDPIRSPNMKLESWTVTDRFTVDNLHIAAGTTLTHVTGGTLTLDVANELKLDAGAVIDLDGRGYGRNTTYPGATGVGNATSGSHIGRGGLWDGPHGTSYGSIYRPVEHGAGGGQNCCSAGFGGGVLRLRAGSVIVNGTIRANGTRIENRGGAGGSIWITTGRIAGTGIIQTNGGDGHWTSGGGGAISIEYTDPTSAVPTTQSMAGNSTGEGRHGGPGSIYTFGPTSTYGSLRVDHLGRNGQWTQFPALGSGIVQPGTGGSTVVTDRSTDIPPYFEGHWVEIRNASGTLKGTWRIASVSGKSFTFEGSDADVAAGDRWQGVYRFDSVVMRGVALDAVDPIRTANMRIETWLTTDRITADNLQVITGATLYQVTGGSLLIDVVNEVKLEAGSVIDLNGSGYGRNTTYPGETSVGNATSGSHIGRGGLWDGPHGTAYGSIYRPAELGAGGGQNCCSAGFGGGVLRLKSGSLIVDGTIRANGTRIENRGGAGGSIWITTGLIKGSGLIQTNGGDGHWTSAGGGAISVSYTDPASVLPSMKSVAGTSTGEGRHGGTGSVYTFGPQSTYGDVAVDATGAPRGQTTVFPSLGRATVLSVNGATVQTDFASIQPFFAGHWVDVFNAGGTKKGTWRIASVIGTSIVLEPNGSSAVDVDAGDNLRGVYLFDNIKVRNSIIQMLDDVRGTKDLDGASSITINDPPVVQPGLIRLESRPEGDFVLGDFGSVQDLHLPIIVTAINKRTGAATSANAVGDGSFSIAVPGEVGDTFNVRATDSFGLPATSRTFPVSGVITATNGIDSLTITPSSIIGGGTVTGTVRMRHPVRRGSEGVATLLSSHAQATLPASVSVPVGSSSVSFNIVTTSVSQDTSVQITASSATTAGVVGTFDILAGSSALLDLQLSESTVEGGTSINATATISSPSSDGIVYLTSSDTRLATVPEFATIASGQTSVTFTVTTYAVPASGNVTITASHGGSKISRPASITACAAMGSVTQPSAPNLGTVWIDDAVPSGATPSGDGTIDTTQFATGTSSIHLSGSAAGTRTFAFTGGAALAVTPNDKLVFYALVNPCNPPREIVVTWKAGTTEYAGSWGETRIAKDVSTPGYPRRGAFPRGGEWTRIEVLAKTLGITANVNITDFSVRAADGEVWIDSVGRSACTVSPNAPPPTPGIGEIVWFDDDFPANAVPQVAGGINTAWQWSTDQAASGSRSHLEPLRTGTHQHYFTGGTDFVAGQNDVLFTYVFIDPCNPPKELQLQFNDGSAWRNAYWGDKAIPTNLIGTGTRIGPMPEAGKWVRLEVPATVIGLANRALNGMAFSMFDGQAWFDRAGKITRVNVALRKTATQSTNYAAPDYLASAAVDGNTSSPSGASITAYQSRPWWEVDLGAIYPIDKIDILGRTDCCTSQTSNFYLHVSDVPFTSTNLEATQAQAGVTSYSFGGHVGALASYSINRTGRYVRIHSFNTDHLTLPEVQVWAPVAPVRVNYAGGLRMNVSSISMWDTWAHPTYGIDGLMNYGHQSGGSIFHTKNNETDPWWELDLGAIKPIGDINIWTRIDGWFDGSTKLWLFLSDEPFASKTFAATFAQAGVSSYYYHTPEKWVHTFPVNRSARYVRVMRSGVTDVGFAELQVWGQTAVLPPMLRTPETPPER